MLQDKNVHNIIKEKINEKIGDSVVHKNITTLKNIIK